MSEQIVRFDKRHASLTAGREWMVAQVQALDLRQPGIDGMIGTLTGKAKEALEKARDGYEREVAASAQAVKDTRDRWKPLIEGFDLVFKALKVKALEVISLQKAVAEKKRKEAEAKLEEARAAVKATNDVKTQETNAVARFDAIEKLKDAKAAMDELPPAGAPTGIKTDQGTLFERVTWEWEVTDLAQVPEEFIQRQVNVPDVDKAVAAGARDDNDKKIPGIHIFPKTDAVARRAKRR